MFRPRLAIDSSHRCRSCQRRISPRFFQTLADFVWRERTLGRFKDGTKLGDHFACPSPTAEGTEGMCLNGGPDLADAS